MSIIMIMYVRLQSHQSLYKKWVHNPHNFKCTRHVYIMLTCLGFILKYIPSYGYSPFVHPFKNDYIKINSCSIIHAYFLCSLFCSLAGKDWRWEEDWSIIFIYKLPTYSPMLEQWNNNQIIPFNDYELIILSS